MKKDCHPRYPVLVDRDCFERLLARHASDPVRVLRTTTVRPVHGDNGTVTFRPCVLLRSVLTPTNKGGEWAHGLFDNDVEYIAQEYVDPDDEGVVRLAGTLAESIEPSRVVRVHRSGSF